MEGFAAFDSIGNNRKAVERRGNVKNLKHFQPGQSGNPAGRPKKLPELDKLILQVLGGDNDESGAQAILEALKKKALKGDVRAAEILLDRTYGKTKERIEHSLPDQQEFTIGGQTIKFG